MSKIRSKLFETFKNLKPDAVPRAPRPDPAARVDSNVDDDQINDPEEEVIKEPDFKKSEDKSPNSKKHFFNNNKKKKSIKKPKAEDSTTINTQATGDVTYIVNSKDVHYGNQIIYNLGATKTKRACDPFDEDDIIKDNEITLLMEADIKPEHQYMDYISKNLGKNWHSIFRALGFTKGRIETMEIDEARNGVSEARYKLLLLWVCNDDDGTLGKLATLLWNEGERQVVKELSIMYKNRK